MIAVLGASGQIGRALLRAAGAKAVGLTRTQLDLSQVETLNARLDAILEKLPATVTALINAAAYTQVDRAEKEPDLALRINAEAPGILAKWAAARGIPFIHYSTDYVFSGAGTRPWTEDDLPAPLSVYGNTKLQGECNVMREAAGGRFLILRTSWVYDASGGNFLNTMLRLGREKEILSVVDDQIGAPSWAGDLARATLHALESALGSAPTRAPRAPAARFPSGIYHLTSSGETSWHGFAQAIFEEARAAGIPLKLRELRAIPSSEYPTPAARPANSRLSNERFTRTFGFGLRPWREALHECMREESNR